MIITVHGYNTDPDSDDIEDRPGPQQHEFRTALHPHDTDPFNWFSAVQGKWSHIFKSVSKYWTLLFKLQLPTTYHWAYEELAVKAADDFLKKYEGCTGLNVFAHSLGSRVVLLAMEKNPSMFGRVCFINAAERVEVAERVIKKAPHVKILNCCVKDDDVLDRAAGYMSPGRGKERIMGQDGIPDFHGYFTQVFLDSDYHKMEYAQEYKLDLRGDNPDSFGDHHYSYRYPGNHALYRMFFDGDL